MLFKKSLMSYKEILAGKSFNKLQFIKAQHYFFSKDSKFSLSILPFEKNL